jgi:hypothetical protein
MAARRAKPSMGVITRSVPAFTVETVVAGA